MKKIALLAALSMLLAACATTTAPTPAAPIAAPAVAAPPVAAGHPIATIVTTMGDIVCELYPDKAPKTVANFIGLAEGTREWTDPASGQKVKRPLYAGTTFHRVIPDFMIQGGDPKGDGTGGPGYQFEDECTADLKFDIPGRLAMANAGPGTNGSQFFVTEAPVEPLNMKHTIFGQCRTPEIVKVIARSPRDLRDKPWTKVVIKEIRIAR